MTELTTAEMDAMMGGTDGTLGSHIMCGVIGIGFGLVAASFFGPMAGFVAGTTTGALCNAFVEY